MQVSFAGRAHNIGWPTVTGEGPLEPAAIAALYAQHAEELRRFVLGLCGDSHLTGDVLQATFAKAIEAGHQSREETRKAWLFRVAFNEAMAQRRRQATGRRVLHQWAEGSAGDGSQNGLTSGDELVRRETVELVRQALDELPPEQAQVVRMRIYDQKKFSEIAAELGIPLGTALGRMRIALEKLRGRLDQQQP